MNDDTRRVLDLLAQGKITVDEADQLLRAMAAPAPDAAASAPDEAARPPLRWVRIAVHKQAKEGHKDKDVNIRVPISIVRSGMRLGALIPGLAGDQVAAKMRERGLDVDFSKLDGAAIDAMLKDLGDTNIEIDSGKAHVRITCE
jgi:SHOCT-like protein